METLVSVFLVILSLIFAIFYLFTSRHTYDYEYEKHTGETKHFDEEDAKDHKFFSNIHSCCGIKFQGGDKKLCAENLVNITVNNPRLGAFYRARVKTSQGNNESQKLKGKIVQWREDYLYNFDKECQKISTFLKRDYYDVVKFPFAVISLAFPMMMYQNADISKITKFLENESDTGKINAFLELKPFIIQTSILSSEKKQADFIELLNEKENIKFINSEEFTTYLNYLMVAIGKEQKICSPKEILDFYKEEIKSERFKELLKELKNYNPERGLLEKVEAEIQAMVQEGCETNLEFSEVLKELNIEVDDD